MKHFALETRSAQPIIETRADDDAPEGIEGAIAAVGELRTAATGLETRLTEQLAAITARLDEAEVRAKRPGNQNGTGEPSIETRAFGTYLRRGDGAPAEELRALTVSNDPMGGYLAPPELSTEFIRNLVLFSPIRAIASIRSTGSPSVKYPRRTGITNAQWEGEIEDQAESTVTFGQTEVPVRLITTFVDISNQLLADSAGQAEAEVILALSEDFGQKEGLSFVSGTGFKQPEGFLTNADVQYTPSGDAATVKADSLIDIQYKLPAAYRNRGTWTMNGTTLAAVRKLKDGNGQYLWQTSIQVGQPETILGRPVVESPDMPDIAANAFPIAFGDFSTGYRIVDHTLLSILVNPYLLATKGITRMHSTRRVGGGVIQPNAIRKLKIAVS